MADRILALAPHACVMCGDEIVFAGAVTVAAKEAAARACATEVTCLAFDPPNLPLPGADNAGQGAFLGLGESARAADRAIGQHKSMGHTGNVGYRTRNVGASGA